MCEQKRILIVEDDAEWRENILRDALEDDGYQLKTCASYEEAAAILEKIDFDLAVVDVNLTGVPGNRDGIRIVERIAEKRKRHEQLTLAPESYDFIILIASAQ